MAIKFPAKQYGKEEVVANFRPDFYLGIRSIEILMAGND